MPFSLKKQYLANERCLKWIEFNGDPYVSTVSSNVSRVIDKNGVVIYSRSGSSGINLFVVANKLFIAFADSSTNSLQILRYTGTSFVAAAFANSYTRISDHAYYGGNLYFIADKMGVVSGFITRVGTSIFKFTGANTGGLTNTFTLAADPSGVPYMNCMDMNPANGDFILGIRSTNTECTITKRTLLGVETILRTITTAEIFTIDLFDGLPHYVRRSGSYNFAKLDALTAGANEVTIAANVYNIGSYLSTSGIIGAYHSEQFDGFLWFRIFDKVFKYASVSPILFETLSAGPPSAPVPSSGFFTALTSELILGTVGKFLTTAIVCDLTLGFPSYTKIDETGVDEDDGIITVNATSSFAIQYSKDGVAWQSSNVFGSLAPGSYDIFIKDSKGCTNQILDITILEFDPVDPPDPVEGTELVIDAREINKNNFISWFNAIGDTAFNSTTITNCVNGYPKPYRLNKQKAKNHYPCIVNGEQFSFYLNFENDYANPNFTSFKLYVIDIYGVVQDDVAPLLQVMAADGVSYFIYANVTLAGLTPGAYRLAIVNVNDAGRILFVSQEIKVITTAVALQETFQVVYKASVNMYRFLYESIPDYVHQIRLRMNVLEENPEGELAQYRAASSGKLRNVYVELDLALKLETYWFDDLAHRAVFTFQVHDYIFLNGKSYLVKTLYKPNWGNPAMWTSKGLLEVYEQDFSTANRYGAKDAIIVVGSDDPLLLGDGGGFIKL